MSIYDAMRTAIGGLQAQSYALEQISGNIANSQTIGYKRTETSFAELSPIRRSPRPRSSRPAA
jgi:flagellar hook protein FlgE